MRRWTHSAVIGVVLTMATQVAAQEDPSDGSYGRLDGDLMLSMEVGVTETVGEVSARGESLAVRLSTLYLSSAGLFAQYNESFGSESQPIARSAVGGIELRPLFLGRWAKDMERGPAHLDLWLDSISLTLGMHNLWRTAGHCDPRPAVLPPGAPLPSSAMTSCHGYGMELSLGMELPLLPRANTPFIALRGGVRWSLDDLERIRPAPPPMGLITLTLGYHHLFEAHLVDAADTAPP